MIDAVAKFLTPLISAICGFLFGLLALQIKDRRERKHIVVGFLIQIILFIDQLAIHLTEPRSQIGWLKVDALLNSGPTINAMVTLKENVNSFSNDIREVLIFYSQWERGHFSDGGIRSGDVVEVRAALKRVSDRAAVVVQRLSDNLIDQYYDRRRSDRKKWVAAIREIIDPAGLWWK